ncbi:MAG: GntR family transcriptional regulator [Burkholderiales bacterium]
MQDISLSDAPLYKAIKQELAAGIASGEWRPGEALPPDARLAERFGVSVGTIRKAIDELVKDRLVSRHQGRGTFVARHDRERMMFQFFNIVPRDRPAIYPGIRTITFGRGQANPKEARDLQIEAGSAVFRIRNVLTFEGTPIIVDDLVLPVRLFRGLTGKVLVERESTIYSLYQTRFGISVIQTRERLRGALATADLARLLGVRKGAPLLEIDRISLAHEERPVELRRSMVNTAAHDYLTGLNRSARS